MTRPAPATIVAACALQGISISAAGFPRGQASPQRPGFEATVSRVRVDAIVTDTDGRFVDDLGPADFRVFEDGRERMILGVQLVDLATGTRVDLGGTGVTEGPAAGAPPAGRGSQPSRRVAPALVAGRGDEAGPSAAEQPFDVGGLGAIVFVIDVASLDVASRMRFAAAWDRLLARTDGLRVPRAAYSVDEFGRLEELAPLGADPATMRQAAQRVLGTPPVARRSLRQRLREVAGDLSDVNQDFTETALAKVREYEYEERVRSLGVYRVLTGFCDALWGRTGRTALVWVSKGVKVTVGGPYSAVFTAFQAEAERREPGSSSPRAGDVRLDLYSPDPEILRRQEELHRAANSANVSIYSVDPTPAASAQPLANDARTPAGAGQTLIGNSVLQSSLDALGDSMRGASAATGGRAFLHGTDIDATLAAIEHDARRFYLLTYAPAPPEGDGEYHEIRVLVRRPGLEVRARSGYVDRPAVERHGRRVEAALLLPGTFTEVPLAADVFPTRRSAEWRVLLAVAIEAGSVGFLTSADGDLEASVTVRSAVLRDGAVVDTRQDDIRAGSRALSSPGSLDGGGLPNGDLLYRTEWTLDAGTYELRVAVLDEVTGRIGAERLQVEIPEPGTGWTIGTPMLLAADGSNELRPIVAERTLPGRSIGVYVEVYNGQRPVLGGILRVAAQDAGADVAPGAQLFPIPMRQIVEGVHGGILPLPSHLTPGAYLVELEVGDRPSGQRGAVRLPFRIVDDGGRRQ